MEFCLYTYPKNISMWIDTIEFVGVYNDEFMIKDFKNTLQTMINKKHDYYLTLNENELIFEYYNREKYEFNYNQLFKHIKILHPGLEYIITHDGLQEILANIYCEPLEDEKYNVHISYIMIENNIIHTETHHYIDNDVIINGKELELGHIKETLTVEKYNTLEPWFINVLDFELDTWHVAYDEQLYIRRIK